MMLLPSKAARITDDVVWPIKTARQDSKKHENKRAEKKQGDKKHPKNKGPLLCDTVVPRSVRP